MLPGIEGQVRSQGDENIAAVCLHGRRAQQTACRESGTKDRQLPDRAVRLPDSCPKSGRKPDKIVVLNR